MASGRSRKVKDEKHENLIEFDLKKKNKLKGTPYPHIIKSFPHPKPTHSIFLKSYWLKFTLK